MLPTIATGNVASALAGEYEVANSLRFDGSGDYMYRTMGTATNRKKFTISAWVKRCEISDNHYILDVPTGSNHDSSFRFHQDNFFGLGQWEGTDVTQTNTQALFRDVSAWYHAVASVDTTQATDSNRVKIYINGVQQTLSSPSYPSLNFEYYINGPYRHNIGYKQPDNARYLDGYLAEMVFIDGQQLDADQFGEFDSATGIWKPIDVSGLTFGNNGFYLDFENSSSLGADVSGNGNNFTVNNLTSIDQSSDTCTNNYATFNSLLLTNSTLSEGNLQAQSPASGGNGGISTFGASKGKWYAEFKQVAESTANEGSLAVIDTTFLHNSNLTSAYLEYTAGTYGLRDNLTNGSAFYTSGGSVTSTSNFHGGWTTNDIIGIALDIDNNRVYFSKNGQWTDGSGNWDQSNPTGYVTIQSDHGEGTYMFAVGDSSGANNVTWSANFGNPAFSISSGNSDGNGYGNFEYSVPSGYYALNTKNLAEYG